MTKKADFSLSKKKCLEIIKKGSVFWNKWREKNPKIKIDLSRENLKGIYLRKANLAGANFSGVDFSEADLSEANLKKANLFEANLHSVYLSRANLAGTDLSKANLQKANLFRADLSRAYLSGADLKKANLRETIFEEANLFGINLVQANLSGANLSKADLRGVNFHEAILSKVNFSKAILVESDLSHTELSYADLQATNLTNAQLTGANLYKADRQNWKIDGIKCDYIFYDEKRENRHPQNRDYYPEEFEQLYKEMPTITYLFRDNMTWIAPIIMDGIVKELQQEFPESEIQLTQIYGKGFEQRAVFEFSSEEDLEVIQQEIAKRYDIKQKKLALEVKQYAQSIQGLNDQYEATTEFNKLVLSAFAKEAGGLRNETAFSE